MLKRYQVHLDFGFNKCSAMLGADTPEANVTYFNERLGLGFVLPSLPL